MSNRTIYCYVDEDSIAYGKQDDAQSCPTAFALNKLEAVNKAYVNINYDIVGDFLRFDYLEGNFGTIDEIEVDDDNIDQRIREIISEYDDTGEMEPFAFIIEKNEDDEYVMRKTDIDKERYYSKVWRLPS